MKLMFFLMGNVDSFEMTRPLLHTLAGAGAELTLVHYSSEEVVPVDDLIATGARYLPLSDGGFGSIPRLARRDYRALCGDDLDFLGLQYHNLARLGFAPSRDLLFEDSTFHQWFHGFAYRAEVLLRECRPDAVLVNHGSEPISRIAVAKARKFGLPTVQIESSFVPGRVLLDPVGMHFFPGENRIEREWPRVREEPLDDARRERIARYLDDWRGRGTSKYAQAESRAEVAAFDAFRDPSRKLLFVVDQVPWDANIINGVRGFNSLAAMVDLARRDLPDGWQAVYKLHPRNLESAGSAVGREADRFLVARDLSIHRLLGASDAVLTFSSNVGLEALAYGRPVLVAGLPHYGRKGLTLELESADGFAARLVEAAGFRPEPELRERYLDHVLFDYLVAADDAGAVLARIEEARVAVMEPTRCPFSGRSDARLDAFRDLSARYNREAEANHDHDRIAARLGLAEASGAEWSRLESGERQVAVDLAGVKHDHLVRYRLARELVRPGADVLDIACGIGYGAFILAEGTGARRVVGVDGSADSIAFAREFWSHPAAEFACESAGGFDAGESAFDLIVSFETVEHLAGDESFCARLWRALRPGGVLALSAPHQLGNPLGAHAFHVRHYSVEGLRGLLDGLDGLAEARVLGQTGESRLEARAAGRQLLLVARKTGGPPPLLGERLDALLPFEPTTPLDLPRGPIRIRPHRFRTDGGERVDGAIEAGPEAENTYLVHGPYCRLEAGRHAARFLIGLEGEAAPGASVVLDVADDYGSVLARVSLDTRALSAVGAGPTFVEVPFRHGSVGTGLQFRVFALGRPFRGRFRFHGVELRSRAMSSDLATGETPADPFERASGVLDLAAVERAKAEEVAQQAEVRRLEYERDRAEWDHRQRELERRLHTLDDERRFAIWERGELARERDELARLFGPLTHDRDRAEAERRRVVAERDELSARLAELAAQLHPYRVVDRLGVVRKGWGLARRLRRKIAS